MGNTGNKQIDLPGGTEDAVKPVGIFVNAGIKERTVSIPTKRDIIPVAVGRFKNYFRGAIMPENQLIVLQYKDAALAVPQSGSPAAILEKYSS